MICQQAVSSLVCTGPHSITQLEGAHSRVSLKAAQVLQEAGSMLFHHAHSMAKQIFAIATSVAARAQCSSFLTQAWNGGAFWAGQHKDSSQRQPTLPLQRSQKDWQAS